MVIKLFSTKAFDIHSSEYRIEACNQALEIVSHLDLLRGQHSQAQAQLNAVEEEISVKYQNARDADDKKLSELEAEQVSATARLEIFGEKISSIEEILENVCSGVFIGEYEKRIRSVERDLRREHDGTIEKLKSTLDALSVKIDSTASQVQECREEILATDRNLRQLDSMEVPVYFEGDLYKKVAAAEAEFQKQLSELGSVLETRKSERKELEQKISQLELKTKKLKVDVRELSDIKDDGLFTRISSGAWWRTLGGDPSLTIEKLTVEVKSVREQIRANDGICQSIQSQLNERAGEKDSWVSKVRSQAILDEFCSQETLLGTHKKRLASDVENLRSLEKEDITQRASLDQAVDTLEGRVAGAIEEEKRNIEGDVINKLNELTRDSETLTNDTEVCSTEIEKVARRLRELVDDERGKIEEETRIKRNVIDGVKEEINQCTHDIAGLILSNRLDVQPPYTTKTFEQRKKELTHLRATSTLYDERAVTDNVEVTGNVTYERNTLENVSGNLYLDFKTHADKEVRRGRWTHYSLRSKLVGLRKKHGQAFFPGVHEEKLLEKFIEIFYPGDIPQLLYLANLSLNNREKILAIRPQVIGPRLEGLLPQGLSLTVKGELWNSPKNPDNPVLQVQDIVDTSQSQGREFERSISALPYIGEQAYLRERRNNILSEEIIGSLPEISMDTRIRLKDWTDYLDWKQTVTQKSIQGIRYSEVSVTEDHLIRFLVITQSDEHYLKVQRILKGDDLGAYPTSYSKDDWDFSFNEEYSVYRSGYGSNVGKMHGPAKVVGDRELSSINAPWDTPYHRYIYFRPDLEAGGEVVEKDSDEQLARMCTRLMSKIPSTGFLANSSRGDIVLIERQREQLKQLETQSGYSPFLSSYLFNIGKANVPLRLVEISDSEWALSSLNDDQKLAVRKMVSTPDIGLVQGPPGTGKTTMIAEAIYQYAIRNKSVLVVSQAHLAVDNVLERLPSVPAIRAIRLGRKAASESSFSSDNCINTYYSALANSCQSVIAEVHATDEKIRSLTQLLSDADFLKSDIEENIREKTRFGSEILEVRGNIAREKEKIKTDQSAALSIEKTRSFKALFSGRSQWSGILSEDVLSVFYRTIVVPIDSLAEIGIVLNTEWTAERLGTAANRSVLAAKLMNRWHRLLSFIPQIEEDIENKVKHGNAFDSGSYTNGRSDDLAQRLEEVERRMKQDASLITEWQQLSAEVEQARHDRQSIDLDFYSSVFISEKVGWLSSCVDASENGKLNGEIVEYLRKALLAVNDVSARIKDGMEDVFGVIDTDLQVNMKLDDTESRIDAMSSKLRELEVMTSEVQGRIGEKIGRMVRHLETHADLFGGRQDFSFENYNATRDILQSELDRLSIDATARQDYKSLWEPVINDWIKDLRNESTVKNDLLHVSRTYVENANVVGVSCNERPETLRDAGHRKFDVVIIDEVSKANPTEIIMPLLLGRTAILVGDHRQLPPLFNENSNSYEELLADAEENDPDVSEVGSELTEANFDRFEKMVTSSLFKEHFENAPDQLKSFIFIQYRMHPQIMQVINQFYENRLICGLNDSDRLHGLTLKNQRGEEYINPDLHVCWIDSTNDPEGRKHYETKFGVGSSKANNLEAALIARVLRDLDEQCSVQGYGVKGMPNKQVGVVTFYNGQARNLRNAIESEQRTNGAFRSIDVDVNTVDRYQGQERPIIVVSMVRNPPWKLSARANTAQFERINVALSRAQELLIVTGACDVFSKYPVQLPNLEGPGKRKVEVYRHIIDEIKRQGGFLKSGDILSQDQFKSLYPDTARRGHPQASKKSGRSRYSGKLTGSANKKG